MCKSRNMFNVGEVELIIIHIDTTRDHVSNFSCDIGNLELTSFPPLTEATGERAGPFKKILSRHPLVEKTGEGFKLVGNVEAYRFLMACKETVIPAICINDKEKVTHLQKLQSVEQVRSIMIPPVLRKALEGKVMSLANASVLIENVSTLKELRLD